MSKYHDHRSDCPFKFASLDVCDCVEHNMLDRIEELTKERDAHKGNADANYSKWVEADAKLAKAVELGDKMAKSIEGNYYTPGLVGEWRATLAEIEGEKG